MSSSSLLLFLVAIWTCATTAVAAYKGDVTFYNIQTGPTACGWYNTNNEHLVAMNRQQWNERPARWSSDGRINHGNQCGRKIVINYNGHETVAVVADLCPECRYGDLDVTPGLFKRIFGSLGPGRVRTQWHWA